MTRDEEIITVCKGFLSAYPSIDQAGLSIGFLYGAVWADKHPKFIWHSPEEEPTENKVLAIDCNKGIKYYTLNYMFTTFSPTWAEIVEDIGIKYWCYIDNLLE